MATDSDFNYLKGIESNVRDAARKSADHFRRLADELERLADHSDVNKIPERAVHAAMWGMANANLDGIAMWLNELRLAEDAIRKIDAEKKED
jgi:hypothetical protein